MGEPLFKKPKTGDNCASCGIDRVLKHFKKLKEDFAEFVKKEGEKGSAALAGALVKNAFMCYVFDYIEHAGAKKNEASKMDLDELKFWTERNYFGNGTETRQLGFVPGSFTFTLRRIAEQVELIEQYPWLFLYANLKQGLVSERKVLSEQKGGDYQALYAVEAKQKFITEPNTRLRIVGDAMKLCKIMSGLPGNNTDDELTKILKITKKALNTYLSTESENKRKDAYDKNNNDFTKEYDQTFKWWPPVNYWPGADPVVFFYSKTRDPNLRYLSNFSRLEEYPQAVPFDLINVWGGFKLDAMAKEKQWDFPTIEHAFSAAKFLWSGVQSRSSEEIELVPESVQAALALTSQKIRDTEKENEQSGDRAKSQGGKEVPRNAKADPKLEKWDGRWAKLQGGKKAFEKAKVELDTEKWNKARLGVMMILLHQRWRQDKKFRLILKEVCQENQRTLVHFDSKAWDIRGNRCKNNWAAVPVKPEGELVFPYYKGDNWLGRAMMLLTDGDRREKLEKELARLQSLHPELRAAAPELHTWTKSQLEKFFPVPAPPAVP